MDVVISIKELKQYNVKLLLNSERKMTYLNLKSSQRIWLNVYLRSFLVIFLKLIVSNGIRKYRDSIVGTHDAIGSIWDSN